MGIKLKPETAISFYLKLIHKATDMRVIADGISMWPCSLQRFLFISLSVFSLTFLVALQVFFIICKYHFQRLLLFTSVSVLQIRM